MQDHASRASAYSRGPYRADDDEADWCNEMNYGRIDSTGLHDSCRDVQYARNYARGDDDGSRDVHRKYCRDVSMSKILC